MNMGNPETLSWFLNYGVEQYPADRYCLIIWDHGGGPLEGICLDELFGGESLTLVELKTAFENSPFLDQKLEWVGFDACLMSTLEVAQQISPYANYMIASQGWEPGTGWAYSFLCDLEKDQNGNDTGRRIIDAYFNKAENTDEKNLACIDLHMTQLLCKELESFFLETIKTINADTFPELARIRQSTISFGDVFSQHNRSFTGETSGTGYDDECFETDSYLLS